MRLGLALLLASMGCRSLIGFDDVTLAPVDTTTCEDSDGDFVCDVIDACPGHDDALDGDMDGIADGCDPWPCSVEPTAPPAMVTYDEVQNDEHITIVMTDTALAGQPTRALVVDPGQTFDVTASFSIIDCICPTCLDQIQVGIIVPNAAKVCLFDGNPQGSGPCATPTLGSQTRQLVAPTTPGQYDIRFALGQDFSCSTTASWFAGAEPTASTTIAVICVR